MTELVFVGTGEAFDPDLPNNSLLYQGERVLLADCGYSIPHAFWRVTQDPHLLDAIFISHLHADHSFGLPALLLWMREAGREKPLTIFGANAVERWLERLLDLAYPGSYRPEKCYEILARPIAATGTTFGPLTLTTAESEHSVQNCAIRIDDGRTRVCYSGDGAPTEATRALYAGADVLVHECYSADDQVRGHARADELLQLAEELDVRTLCLVHLSRSRKASVAECVARHRGRTRVVLPRPSESLQVLARDVRSTQ
jgi:ribonuclease BN (tRNA processing enzyme)